MKTSRKLISLVLTIILAFSCFSVCAFATLGVNITGPKMKITSGTAEEVDSYIQSLSASYAQGFRTLEVIDVPNFNYGAALQKLSKLTKIIFNNCGITSLDWISYGSRLTNVELPNNSISDLSLLPNFSSVTDWDLSNNEIWDLNPIASATNITKITLDQNRITDFKPLFTNSSHIYSEISLKNNFISDSRGIKHASFDGSVTTYIHLDNNFIKKSDINSNYNNSLVNGHISDDDNTPNSIPSDPFVAIEENGVQKIVGYFGAPSTKHVTIGSTAYKYKNADGSLNSNDKFSNVTSIAQSAFQNNGDIESVYIGDNIRNIDSFAFDSCTSLRRVRLSESPYFTTLKKHTFLACINLLGVCIPNNITTVETKAFDLCKRLKYVEFSNKDTSVHAATFYRCNGDYLTIYVSSGIAESVWQTSTLKSSLDSLLYVSNYTLDRNLEFSNGTLTNASLTGTTLRVPAGIDNVNFVNSLNCGNYALAKFLMPEGVTSASIGFVGANISSVEILVPQTLNDISYITFPTGTTVTAYTYGNASVTNTNNYTINTDYKIAYDTLRKYEKTLTTNTYLTLIDLGYDIIGSFAFYGIDSDTQTYNSMGNYMKSITLPNGIVKIDTCAFKRLKLMETVTLNNDGMLKTIGDGAFWYCLYLNNVVVPASVETIGGEAFYYCTRLTNITFNLTNISTNTSDLTEIGDGAFRNCTQLGSIYLPSSVTTLGPRVFKNDTYLETINFGDNSSLTSIGEEIFQYCTSLNNNDPLVPNVFKIPNEVSYIPAHAFKMRYGTMGSENNSFNTIELPSSISSVNGIHSSAFEDFETTGRTIVITCTITNDNIDDVQDLWIYLDDLGFTVLPEYDDIVVSNRSGSNEFDYETRDRAIENETKNTVSDFDSESFILDYLNSHNDFEIDVDAFLHDLAIAQSQYYSSLEK